MRYEVEQKHRVGDLHELLAQLAQRGVVLGLPVEQADCYFAHPARDFARTDEALRIRTVGEQSFVTYKGPKIDRTTKTRREIELPLAASDGDGSRFAQLLESLGFTAVAMVRKQRRPFQIEFDGRTIDGAVDELRELGAFVELELLAEDGELDAARGVIRRAADELQLGPVERRSYLELLLEKSSAG